MFTVNQRRIPIYLLLLVVILMTGCSSIILPEQTYHNNWVSLDQERQLGQSFVSRFDGLNGFGIYLKPEYLGEGKAVLSLYPDPTKNDEIIDKSLIPVAEVNLPGFYYFSFVPQSDSTNQYYYISLGIDGTGSLQVNTGDGNAYLNGALYTSGISQDAQMTFNLRYDRGFLVLGLIKESLHWLSLIFLALWIYVLPGWALLGLILPKWDKTHWSVKVGLSAGVSLASYPILFLWTDLIGVHLGVLYAWLMPILGVIIIIWKYRALIINGNTRKRYLNNLHRKYIECIKSPHSLFSNLALIFVMALIIFSRFWAVRNLDLPLWGDSYQHTMIVQLMLENGGLFQSWFPYTSLNTLTYHFGFHANTAAFAWLSGKPAADSVLWVGQIINILAVLTLIPIGYKIRNNRWVSVFIILISGLLLDLPAYYVNWGRYTQLTGQAILVTVVYFAWIMLEKPELDWQLLAISCVVAGGLALTHYRVVIFAILFIPAYWFLHIRGVNHLSILRRVILYGLGSGIIFLPWLFKLSEGKILKIVKRQLTNIPLEAGITTQTIRSIGRLDQYLPLIVWSFFIISLIWLLWKKYRDVGVIGIWWFLNLIFTNPAWFGLPGNGVISNFALFIAAYIPASLVIAIALSVIISDERDFKNTFVSVLRPLSKFSAGYLVIFILVIGLSIWGASQQRKVADPYQYALATRSDVIAARWINANLESDAHFLINSFLAFNNAEAAGSDGGWWLPLLANRQTFITPLTSGFESGNQEQSSAEIEIIKAIQDKGLDDPQVMKMLSDQGLSHVYIGQRQGIVNTDSPLLDLEFLINSPYFLEKYHQDRVWVFEIRYDAERY